MISPIGKNRFTPLEITNYQRKIKFLTGFTLTELLLSTVILSFGLVAIIGSYLTAANALDSTQNRLKAIEILQGKLAILQQETIEQNGLTPATFKEDTTLNNRLATYALEISALPATEELDLSGKLNTVKLSLVWKERNIDKDATIFTYLEKKPNP